MQRARLICRFGRLVASLPQNPAAKEDDELTSLGDGESETLRVGIAAFGVIPANQSTLEAPNLLIRWPRGLAGSPIHELMSVDGFARVVSISKRVATCLRKLWLKELKAGFTARLAQDHGRIRITQEFLRRVPVVLKAIPDAGGDRAGDGPRSRTDRQAVRAGTGCSDRRGIGIMLN